MERAFQRLNHLFYAVVVKARGQTQRPGMNNERLGFGFRGSHQSQTETLVYNGFQRSAGTPEFPAQELGDVVIQGKCRAHILMFADKAS
jgi:hypothetical protein